MPTVNGNSGNNILNGGNGSDTIIGYAGNDTMNGGGGNDTFIQTITEDYGYNDFIDGGSGKDTLVIQGTAHQLQLLASAIDAWQASDKSQVFHFGSYAGGLFNLDIVNVESIKLVTLVNHAPVGGKDTASVSESSLPNAAVDLTGNILTNDSDPDVGDVITVTTVSPMIGIYGTVVMSTNGAYSYSFNSTTSEALSQGQVVHDIFTYQISDGQGGTTSAILDITITGTNDAPVATVANIDLGDRLSNMSTSVSSYFSDVDVGDARIYILTGAPAGVTINSSTGALSFTFSNSHVYNLEGAFVKVVDSQGSSSASIALHGSIYDASYYGSVFMGTLGSDTMVASGPNAVIIGNLGDDQITGSAGHDLLIGESMNYTQNIIATNTSITVTNASVYFGDDILTGNGGADMLFGDFVSMSATAQGGTVSAGSANGAFGRYIYVFGADTLNGGIENDTLVGDVGNMVLTAQGGSSNIDFYSQAQGLFYQNTYLFGNDTLQGNGGQDVFYGDVQNLSIIAHGGTSTGGDASAQLTGNVFNFGMDNLTGGTGNDKLVGDVGIVTLNAISGNVMGVAQGAPAFFGFYSGAGNTTNFGNDILDGKMGNNLLYGDVETMSMISLAGTSDWGLATTKVISNNFVFGADTMIAGAGADTLVGDTGTMTLISQGGVTNSDYYAQSISLFTNSTFSFGNDTMNGGDGDNMFVGDVQIISVTAQGGTSSPGFSNAQFMNNAFNFGADTLISGAGNDSIIGDVEAITFDSIGGTSSAGGSTNTILNSNSFTFGADNLIGGSGTNQLVGDIGTLTIDVHYGTGVNSSAAFQNNTFTLGNDTLNGGSGVDTMIGDIQVFSFVNNLGIATGDMIRFGNDILNAGSGSEIMYGDAMDLSQFVGLLAADVSNVIVLGNNTLVAGAGNDVMWGAGQNLTALSGFGNQVQFANGIGNTFVFDMGLNNGNYQLMDFANDQNAANATHYDTLNFKGSITNQAQLDEAVIGVTNNGSGGTMVTFVGGGVLDFHSVLFSGQTHIEDIVSMTHITFG